MPLGGEQYELVSSREWEYHHQRPAKNMEHQSDDDDYDPYSLANLDADWLPVLSGKIHGPIRKQNVVGSDTTDFGIVSNKRDLPDVGDDIIDGRGKFQRREVEDELRSMPWEELENGLGISHNKIRDILKRADVNRDGEIDYRVFLEEVKRYRLHTEHESKLKEVVAAFAFAEEFSCNPPTLFMLVITLVELAFFIYLCVHLSTEHGLQITWEGPVPYCSVLIYNPYRRYEAWRYVTYMFVHIGIAHFVFNMIMQILVGVFLEMQQEGWIGSLRVATVYLCGVLAGSLGTSLSDPNTYIAGASGGVYSLIAAHLATMALNWKEDSAVRIKKVIHQPLTRIVRLVFILLLTVHDVALAVYVRLTADKENRTGFMGHLCGAMAGLLVGIVVLENRRVRHWELWVKGLCFMLFGAFVLFAVLWNIFAEEWTGQKYYPTPDHSELSDENGKCAKYFYY